MSNKEIHKFALKWFDKFRDTKATGRDLCEDTAFADECFALGFQMDCGESFIAAYPDLNVFSDYRELDKIIDSVEDIQLLGSAIFSKWRYFNHWAGNGEEITLTENRGWFITALGRLELLTSESGVSGFVFKGTLKKAKLISNSLCYGPCPMPDDEIEQRLTLTDDGRLFFTRYNYGNGEKYIKSAERRIKLDNEVTAHLLKILEEYFSDEFNVIMATDVGEWKLILTNTEDEDFCFRGSLVPTKNSILDNISDIFRSSLDMPELYMFDGNAFKDRIEKMVIDYHRNTKIKPSNIPEGTLWEFVTWDYSEKIVIDRKNETMTYIHNIGTGCVVERKYCIEGGIDSLLEGYDTDEFLNTIEGNPDDVVKNPLETKDYTITIDFLYGKQRVITGTFDKYGLPEDFPELANNIISFMQFYEINEILDSSVYGKALRRQSELIFCNVIFEEYGKEYCYLTDDDTLEKGDLVIVPVGHDNHRSIARISSIEYHKKEEAPFPIERIKKIIRKCTDKDFESDDKDI